MSVTLYRSLGWVLLAALIALWELVARLEVWPALLFPAPSRVAQTFFTLVMDGTLPSNLAASLINMFAGYFLAAIVAVPMGIFIGYYRRLFNLFEPLLELIRPLPATAIIPLVMLFLGIGPAEKIFIIFFTCARVMIVNAVYGVRDVEPRLIDTARSYGYRGWRLIWRVVVPSSLPQIMSGLRICVPISIVVIIAAEMLGSENGIGAFTIVMQRSYSTPEMYAGIVSLCFLGFILNAVFVGIESKAMWWYQNSRTVRN